MREGSRWLTPLAVGWFLWATIIPEEPGDLHRLVPEWQAIGGPFKAESSCVKASRAEQARYPTLMIDEREIPREYRCLPGGKRPAGMIR